MTEAAQAAPRRRIGRILSLGFPMPGVRVDNYSFISAPSFFDYDAIVVNVAALSKLFSGVLDGSVEAMTFADRPVRAVAGAEGAIALADVIQRRRDEASQMLANGGVIALFAYPAQKHDVPGLGVVDDLHWLTHAPAFSPAEGDHVELQDDAHPIAPFLIAQRDNISYRARIESPNTVIARSVGGAAVAAELASATGRIVGLPALKSLPAGEARYAMSDALQAGLRRMLGVMAEGREPPWMAEYAARLPHDLSADERARWCRLLWQEGQLGLEDVALDALKLIGFDVYASNPDALELRSQGTLVLLEIEGGSEAVGLAPHYRLRQRIERTVERGGDAPHGLLVVNGFRHDAPAGRRQQASSALVKLAEMSYAIVPATLMFDAVAATLSGDDAPAALLRRRLLAEHGLIEAASTA
jgi:hypothetical protein